MDQHLRLIGICLSTIHDEDRYNFVKELNRHAVSKGYRLIVFNSCSDLYEQNNADNEGAASVFRLIPYHKLSALIIFPNFIHRPDIIECLKKECFSRNIPVISIDEKMDGCINYSFTYADVFERLCRHVIEEHHARNIFMISGYRNNSFSEERVDAFKRALAANGIPCDPNNIGYGGFWEGPTNEILNKWFIEEKRPLPDAIICANDIMAITVSGFLQKQGYIIPDDCIITGFDGIEQAGFHLPHLTTCKQDYDEMGRSIMETITAIQKGESCETDVAVGFNMILSQSCGCRSISSRNINMAIQTLIDRMKLADERHNMICTVPATVSHAADIYELVPSIIDKFRFHTSVFALNNDILLPPLYGSHRRGSESFSEFSEILYQRYYWHDGEPCTVKTSELLPSFNLLTVRSEPIIVCAAHFVEMVMGYCIFQPDVDVDEYKKIHTFMSTIGATLGDFHGKMQIRSINSRLVTANSELQKLSQRDFMTGLFNRRGFFSQYEQLVASASTEGSTLIIISADLDCLKTINDSYGHHEGDNAITTVSRALLSSCVQGEICARFGGDEFCVAALIPTSEADYYFSEFKGRFLDYLYDYNRKSDKPYTVNASIGCCIEKMNCCSGLDAMIQTADEHMYADKQIHRTQNAS